MKTYYVFRSESSPDLRGFTDDPSGSALPTEDGPWSLAKTISPDATWDLDVSRAVVAAAINNNGFGHSAAMQREGDHRE
jgi:hypothetical protein